MTLSKLWVIFGIFVLFGLFMIGISSEFSMNSDGAKRDFLYESCISFVLNLALKIRKWIIL